MEIAVDFDGTCVAHEYPNIGKDIGAVPVLKKLVENGHKLILYTMRSDESLADAVQWFDDNEIELYSVQINPQQFTWTKSTKCYAQLYIDDAALGAPFIFQETGRPFIDWGKVSLILKSANLI